jgi:hypothetical protein
MCCSGTQIIKTRVDGRIKPERRWEAYLPAALRTAVSGHNTYRWWGAGNPPATLGQVAARSASPSSVSRSAPRATRRIGARRRSQREDRGTEIS